MLRSAKSLLNIPIISLYNSLKVGNLRDFIVDPEAGKIIGILVLKEAANGNSLVLSTIDIREMSDQAIIVDSEEVLVLQTDIVRIDSVLKTKIEIFNNKVFTESGKNLGRVQDYLIDDLFFIAKLYVKPALFNIMETEVIIPREAIVKVTKEKIIVSASSLKKIENLEPVRATQ